MLVASLFATPPLKFKGVKSEELDYDLDCKKGGKEIYRDSPNLVVLVAFHTPTWFIYLFCCSLA
jgi:hypothetical protein